MIENIMWLSLLAIVYCYFIYPLILFLIGTVLRKGVKKGIMQPDVSIVISAFNEQDCIRKNLQNKLGLFYDPAKLEIIVVSDASTDRTDEIVRSFAPKGVKLIRQLERQGKTAALNRAVGMARGEIICFADANSLWDGNALNYLLRNFADPTVGYVTGKMIYVNEGGSAVGDGCSLYMKYENKLREWETRIGSIVGVDGGIDAVRKHLYKPMPSDALPDFILPLTVVEQGYRVVYESKALLKEETLNQAKDELKMRVRVTLRALNAIWSKVHMLNPARYAVFSWQLLSHKLLRYFVWLFMITLIAANVLVSDKNDVYFASFLAQMAFYVAVVYASLLQAYHNKLSRLMNMVYYFALVNVSSAIAFVKFMKREKTVIWQPRKG